MQQLFHKFIEELAKVYPNRHSDDTFIQGNLPLTDNVQWLLKHIGDGSIPVTSYVQATCMPELEKQFSGISDKWAMSLCDDNTGTHLCLIHENDPYEIANRQSL